MGKKGFQKWRLSHFSTHFYHFCITLKISKTWFKEVWMYGYTLYLVTVFRVIVWTRMWKLFWISGDGANFPWKQGWWSVRLSHFSRFLSYWKFENIWFKENWMYGYTLYLVTVFSVIVWTCMWKIFLNFGSWVKFPRGKRVDEQWDLVIFEGF